jgi:hypothetical protein
VPPDHFASAPTWASTAQQDLILDDATQLMMQVAYSTRTKASSTPPWLSAIATFYTIQLDPLGFGDDVGAVATARSVAKTARVFGASVSTSEYEDKSIAHVEKGVSWDGWCRCVFGCTGYRITVCLLCRDEYLNWVFVKMLK